MPVHVYGCEFPDYAAKLADVHVSVEEMALTSAAQIHKLEVILEELDKRLGSQDSSRIKWNVKRESCSQLLAFSNKATSHQMFCLSGSNFQIQHGSGAS